MLDRLTRTPHSRFSAACGTGAAVAMVVFAWFLLAGRSDLFGRDFLSNFYDVQARSLLHGHWDVPANSLAFERFRLGGKYYTYFGPWPAVLRMPVIAFTHDLDGRLNRVSMLLAFGVMLAYVSRLSWQARSLVRGDGMPTRRALVAAGGFVFMAGCGSTTIFLASRSWVYHEAILWAIAWSLASYSYLAQYLVAPSRRAIAFASIAATLAFLSRATVGSGPVIALALLLAARAARWVRDTWRQRHPTGSESTSAPAWWLQLLGLGRDTENRSIWPVAVATAVPAVLYAYVNVAKFGSLFRLPLERQDRLIVAPQIKAALAANHGSLFGLRYGPTNLLQYFRPDAISFDRLFPWITFSGPPRVIGGARFVAIDNSTSITAASTLVLLLAVVGVLVVLRARRSGDEPTVAVLRVPIIAAAIAGVEVLFVAYLEQRYEADFVPLFVLGAAVGLWSLPWLLGERGRVARAAVTVGLVVLAAWSCWVNGALTLLHQRAYGPFVAESTLAGLVDFQLAVHEQLPGGTPSRVGRSRALPLPAPGPQESLFVVGDCAGLYWSSGNNWFPVEETPATGRFRLRARFAAGVAGTREPLLTATDDRGSSIVWAHRLAGDRVRFEYEWTGRPATRTSGGAAVTVSPRRPVELAIRLDPVLGYFEVRTHGRIIATAFAPIAQSPATIGRQLVSTRGTDRFAGTLHPLATPTPACDRLRPHARRARRQRAPGGRRAMSFAAASL